MLPSFWRCSRSLELFHPAELAPLADWADLRCGVGRRGRWAGAGCCSIHETFGWTRPAGRVSGRVRNEKLPRALEITAATGTQETVRADLGEAPGKYVLEEASDEDLCRQALTPCLLGARVRVAEGDALVLKPLEPIVRKGHAVDVPREIERGLLTGADLLDVDRPGALPDSWINLLNLSIEAGPPERVAQLRAKKL